MKKMLVILNTNNTNSITRFKDLFMKDKITVITKSEDLQILLFDEEMNMERIQ